VEINDTQQIQLGLQAYQEVLSGAKVVRSGPIVDEVRQVTNRLVQATKNPEFLRIVKIPPRRYEWEVNVVQDAQVNAFCLPGGKMVVYTGILPVCQSDAGLATVMGHEIAHALGQHGAERMSHAKMAQLGMTAAGATMSPEERAKILPMLNAGAKFGIMSYGRTHESEADHIGVYLMAAAGYNPHESVKFWERMKAVAKGSKTPEFLSTHPSHETRIRDLLKWIPEAMPLYRASGNRDEPRKLSLR
jgi:predicted Zn-dependent protease